MHICGYISYFIFQNISITNRKLARNDFHNFTAPQKLMRRMLSLCPEALHWRHNDHDGVSNHEPHGCLLSCLFRRRSKKTSKLRVTGLCVGNSPGPVNSPHKGPVTRKMFPFDDVIMDCLLLNTKSHPKGKCKRVLIDYIQDYGWCDFNILIPIEIGVL